MAFRKLTPEVKARLLQAIQLGTTYEMACQYAGISVDSFANYRKNSDFSAEVKRAEAAGLVGWLARIEKAANEGEWQAAAWKAERRYPQTYGRRVQEVTGRVEVVTDGVRDRLAGRLDELAERRRAKAGTG